MVTLIFNRKYTSDMIKEDISGAFTAAAWIFPLSLAFGVNSPFGASAGIWGGIIACLIGANNKNNISAPNLLIFLILFYSATQLGVQSAMLSAIIAGVLLILLSLLKVDRRFPRISPVFIGAVSFAAAIILCIIQVNFYFGIGVPQGHALFTLAAYKSFGFHSNWRGVLFGTITLVIMITYPIKFKKFSKKLPESFVSLVGTTLLNCLFLNPDSTHTVIDEIGKFPNYLIPSVNTSLFTEIRKENLLYIFIYAFSIFSIYIVEAYSKEKRPCDIKYSLLLKGVNSAAVPILGGLPTSSTKVSLGRTKLTNLYSAVFLFIFALVFHPILERVPIATLGVIIIVLGWKSPSYKSMKKVFYASRFKIIKILLMFVLIFLSIIWNIAYVVCILAIVTLVYSIIKNSKNKK